jgi:hypothetical protein
MDINSGSRIVADNPRLSVVAHLQRFRNRIWWQLRTAADELLCSSEYFLFWEWSIQMLQLLGLPTQCLKHYTTFPLIAGANVTVVVIKNWAFFIRLSAGHFSSVRYQTHMIFLLSHVCHYLKYFVFASPFLIQVKRDFYLTVECSMAVRPRILLLRSLPRLCSTFDNVLCSCAASNLAITSLQMQAASFPWGIREWAQDTSALAVRANLISRDFSAFWEEAIGLLPRTLNTLHKTRHMQPVCFKMKDWGSWNMFLSG